jgi:hypothetical protein
MNDAFDDAFALLAAAADVPGTKARLTELRQQITAAAKAKMRFEADSAAIAAAQAALDEREARVTERERVVLAWELEAAERGEREKFPFSANLEPGGRSHSGLTREAYRS